MAHLTLTGVSDDGRRLLLVDSQGVEHTLDITPGLRAALRGEGSRQLEIKMDSVLRPRDIQTRIRAGEDAESVAAAARTSVEAIMPFVGPVLAERAHVAERAQRSTLRRTGGEAGGSGGSAGGSRVLGDLVEQHLRAVNVPADSVEWDAWRREDGRWSLRATFASGARTGTAAFTFDMPGNYVLLDNDDARWLVGEALPAAPAPTPRDDLESARLRRLGVADQPLVPAPDDDAGDDLGTDAIELVTDEPAAVREPEPAPEPAPAETTAPEATAAAEEPDAEDEPAARRTTPKRKGRASVPSWDEIMFGGGDQ